MKTCLKCGKEILDVDRAIYGIIEKYHYDTRRTTLDNDYGPTKYCPIAIVRADVCDECEKKATASLLKEALKTLGGSLLAILIGFITGPLSNEFGGLLEFAGLLGIIVSIVMFIKSFLSNNKTKRVFNGKVSKENVIYPVSEKDLDIEDIPGDNYNRHDYKYIFINEDKLRKPLKETKHESSYNAALNELKKWYKELDKTKQAIDDNNVINLDIHKDDVKKENTEENKETKFKVFNIKIDDKKRKMVVIALTVLVALGIFGGILAFIINKTSTTINLEDFLYDDITGYELNGKYKRAIDYSLIMDKKGNLIEFVDGLLPETIDKDIDEKRLQEVADYIKENDYSYEAAFEIIDIYDYDHNMFLSSGDVVNYRLNDDLEILNLLFKCKFKAPTEGSYTVGYLQEDPKVDLLWWFSSSHVKYEGANGFIKAKLDLEDVIDTVVYEQDETKIILNGYNVGPDREYQLCLYKNDNYVNRWVLDIENDKYLSIGDAITISINGYESLENYGIILQAHSIVTIVEKQTGEVLESGVSITKEMVEDFIVRDLTTRYDNFDDLEIEYIKLRKAMFFRIPDEYQDEAVSIVSLDYNYSVKYKYQDKWYTDDGNIFGTANNPYIEDNDLCAMDYEISDSDTYYDAVEEEYALVDERINITNYSEFLELIASDKSNKLVEAGYENIEIINLIKDCFMNDSMYVIY